jgi:hypothetical protein
MQRRRPEVSATAIEQELQHPQEMRPFQEAITAHQDAAASFGEADDQHSERIALANLEAARVGQETWSRPVRLSRRTAGCA